MQHTLCFHVLQQVKLRQIGDDIVFSSCFKVQHYPLQVNMINPFGQLQLPWQKLVDKFLWSFPCVNNFDGDGVALHFATVNLAVCATSDQLVKGDVVLVQWREETDLWLFEIV